MTDYEKLFVPNLVQNLSTKLPLRWSMPNSFAMQIQGGQS